MSKYNMLLGYASGKVGDIVMYHSRGHENARAYNPEPKNPKTASQMTQRTQLAPLVEFFRVSKELLGHSFASRPIRQSSYNAFIQANLGRFPLIFFTKEMAINHASVIAPYRISSGTLSPINHYIGETAIQSDIVVTIPGAWTSVRQLTQNILENNNGFAEGDQLSFVMWNQSSGANDGFPYAQMYLYEVTLDLRNEDGLPVPQSYFSTLTNPDLNQYTLSAQFATTNVGGCYIHSRKETDGSLNVSPQEIVMPSSALYLPYTTELAQLEAMESYKYQPEKFLTPGGKTNMDIPSQALRVSDMTYGGAPLPTEGHGLDMAQGAKIVLLGEGLAENISTLRLYLGTSESASDSTIKTDAILITDVVSTIAPTSGEFVGTLLSRHQDLRTIAVVSGSGPLSRILYVRRIRRTEPPSEETPYPIVRLNELAKKAEAEESLTTEELDELTKLQKEINAKINETKKKIVKAT